MPAFAETLKQTGPGLMKERLVVKAFRDSSLMHEFLNRSDNSWRESTRGLKAGTYAYAGGRWWNVKHLPSWHL